MQLSYGAAKLLPAAVPALPCHGSAQQCEEGGDQGGKPEEGHRTGVKGLKYYIKLSGFLWEPLIGPTGPYGAIKKNHVLYQVGHHHN